MYNVTDIATVTIFTTNVSCMIAHLYEGRAQYKGVLLNQYSGNNIVDICPCGI